jgi:diacylglycerol kinase (ATP)
VTTEGRPANVTVVVNPAAGRGRSSGHVEGIVAAMAKRGVHPDIELSRSPEHAAEVVASLANSAERVIVAGGDGMVHIAAQQLAESTVVLGIIPVGTGNDFAAAAGLPVTLDEAVSAALSEPVPVDLMRVGSSYVTTVATFGFAADVNVRAESMSFPKGPSRYTVATVLQLPRMKRRIIRVGIDEEQHEHTAVMVAVANTTMFGGGMQIAPDARHSDGLSDVVVIGDIGRATLLRVLPRTFSGAHVKHPDVTQYRGKRIVVSGDVGTVRADGEALTTGPFEVISLPGSLLVAGANRGAP